MTITLLKFKTENICLELERNKEYLNKHMPLGRQGLPLTVLQGFIFPFPKQKYRPDRRTPGVDCVRRGVHNLRNRGNRMSDFYQAGDITTLHRLGKPKLEVIERELKGFAKQRPIALVIPALSSEFEGSAIRGIVEELKKVEYIHQIVLSLGQATDGEFKRAKKLLSVIPCDVKIIHNNGGRIQDIYSDLDRHGLWVGEDGKGRATWMAYGYILATGKAGVIATHDCDILTYHREMLARLCYPVANPGIDFVFCKGFYSRVSDRMHGRATRLLLTPLIRALRKIVGPYDFLEFLNSFRYPLAGEFCLIADLAMVSRIPWDWGLEVGLLAEVFRNYSPRRVCQVEITDNYEHKHQDLSPEDITKGLMGMCVDISKTIFRVLAAEGVVFTGSLFNSLEVAYLRFAEDLMNMYEADAELNGLIYDRNMETKAVEAFTNAVKTAAKVYMENPLGTPLIPSWLRVNSAMPGILNQVKKAVDDDNR